MGHHDPRCAAVIPRSENYGREQSATTTMMHRQSAKNTVKTQSPSRATRAPASGPWGGADLRFYSSQPDTDLRCVTMDIDRVIVT